MIGERLKQLRKNKGITQRELADIIGVRKSVISLYETNKNDPSDPIKITLAKYFNISLDYLVGVIDIPVKYYSKNNFVELPENITNEENQLICKFVDFVVYCKNH